MEPPVGHEPTTFPLPWGCSTNWAMAAYLRNELAYYMIEKKNSSFCGKKFFSSYFQKSLGDKCSIFILFEKRFFDAISSHAEHDIFYFYCFFCQSFFSFLFSSIVRSEWTRIGPSSKIPPTPFLKGELIEARSGESEASIRWVIPVGLIVLALISWFCEIGQLIVMPSDRLEILHNIEKFFLHLCFCDRVRFPVFRIFFIFEHIDTRMRDKWEFCMEFFYSFQCFSWKCVGKSEDEIYVDRGFTFFVILAKRGSFSVRERFSFGEWQKSNFDTFECFIYSLFTRSMDFLQACIVHGLYSHRESGDPEIEEPAYVILGDIFRIGFESDLTCTSVVRKKFEDTQ